MVEGLAAALLPCELAIFCATDEMALGAIKAGRASSRRVLVCVV